MAGHRRSLDLEGCTSIGSHAPNHLQTQTRHLAANISTEDHFVRTPAPALPNTTSVQHAMTVDLEARVEVLEEKIDSLLGQNTQLREKLIRAEVRQSETENTNNELYKRLGVLITTTGTLSERLKSLETTTYVALKQELQQQKNDFAERETDISRLFSNFKDELSRVAASSITMAADLEARQNQFLVDQRQEYENSVTLISKSASSKGQILSAEDQRRAIESEVRQIVGTTLEDFQHAQSSSLQEMARKLEQEIEKRHRRLVDSTQVAVAESSKGYEAVAPQIRTLQNEMLNVREQIRLQASQIDAQRNDASFEHAINEMKDWIQDIERKIITRTEVEEAVLQLSSQVASVKHTAQSTEAVLSQKLEVEKSTRESAVSQLASQLLLGGKRKQ